MRQSKWIGIIAVKTERTQINFFSDVLVAEAFLDLKVPIAKYAALFPLEFIVRQITCM